MLFPNCIPTRMDHDSCWAGVLLSGGTTLSLAPQTSPRLCACVCVLSVKFLQLHATRMDHGSYWLLSCHHPAVLEVVRLPAVRVGQPHLLLPLITSEEAKARASGEGGERGEEEKKN